MIGMAVGLHDVFNLESFRARDVEVCFDMAQRVDDHRLAIAYDDVTQAATRWPADLVDAQLAAFGDWVDLVEVAPCLHATL